jgi:signal transduction histidine kinase
MIATAVLAAVATVVLSSGATNVALRAAEGHVAIETAASLISLLIAFIALGRFLQAGYLIDLLLAAALVILGVTNLAFSVIPAAAGTGFHPWATWAPVAGRLLSAIGFAAAAFAGEARTRRPREAIVQAAVVCTAALVAIGAGIAAFGSKLPMGIDPSLSPSAAGPPRVVGNTALLVIQLVTAAFYLLAAIGFAARAQRTRDQLLGWLALASVLAGFAFVNYFLFPSLYSRWLFTGDYLRIGFYLALLGGVVNEIQLYQRGVEQAAALEERRRLARELHDGLAQELAFIATQTRWLSRRAGESDGMSQLVVAAERALDESRSAISALTRPMDEPLDAAIAQAAEEVAARVGVRLRLDLAEGVEVPPSTREALIRIVREAVSNTARHGNASKVTVQLEGGPEIRLRVDDDGIGFDPAMTGGPGFGLTSMRERAQALGAQFRVSSSPGGGTEIEVVLR